MINRILVVVFIGLFSAACLAASEAEDLQAEADKALEGGDFETALDSYMAILELEPSNIEAIEFSASLARELGITELAADLWIRRAELAVNQADIGAVIDANKEITGLHQAMPDWVGENLARASQFSEDQADILQMWEEMTGETQAAMNSGDAEGAVASQEGLLMVASDTFGELHWLTISASRDLGYIYHQLGMAEEAEGYYADALMAAEKALGESHPNTLEITELMAGLYSSMGALDAAREMIQSVVAGYESTVGADHELSLGAKVGEIDSLKSIGQYKEAMESLLALCATVDLSYGIYHPQATRCLTWVADLQQTMGQLAEAETSYKLAITRMSVSLANVDGTVLDALSQLAEIYRVSGRYQESKDLLSGVIQVAIQSGEIEGSYVAKSYLGRVLSNEGQSDKAEAITQEVLDYGVNQWQDDPIKVFNVLLELGGIYQAQGRLADAEASFEEVLQGVTETYGDNHPTTMVASNALDI